MRLESLALKGLLCFTDPLTLDLRDVPPGVIAITGENGAGKTTLLEAAFAALHRSWPSRDGALVDYALGRDSFLDVAFTIDGKGAFRARVNLDGVKRASDAVLEAISADGTRVALTDGKVSTYQAVIDRDFPSKALLLAGALSAQNKRGNVIGMKPAEGKKLFAELLGLAHYETMSQTAKTIAAAVAQAIDRLTAVRALFARDSGDDVAQTLDRIAQDLQVDGVAAETRQRELRAAIAQLEGRLAQVQEQVAAYAAASQRVMTLERELAGRQIEQQATARSRESVAQACIGEQQRILQKRDADIADVDKRLAGNQQILGRADAIRAAAAAVKAIDAQLRVARTARDEDIAAIATAMTAVRDAERSVDHISQQIRDLAAARQASALLTTVPCGGREPYAACQFLTNARAAQQRIADLERVVATEPSRRARLADAIAAHDRAVRVEQDGRQSIAALESDRTAQQHTAAYAEPLAAAEARILELTAARQQMLDTAAHTVADAQARADARLRELTAHATALEQTSARLVSELDTARGDLATTEHGNARALVLQEELRGARGEWDVTTAELARIRAARADLTRRRTELLTKRAQLADVDDRLTRLQTEQLAWAWLAKALGKDGLQVLEIDGAGPTVSLLTNQLLAACDLGRFTVELVTQAAKIDGSELKEDFRVQVFDNERGGTRTVADLSGGEQVIVSEALRNAIAIYVNQRSPMAIRTAWRDETTGALDPLNADRYLAMLRKVHQLGGLHHLFFVTHNAAIAAQADAQIRVADGTATLVFPPFSEAA